METLARIGLLGNWIITCNNTLTNTLTEVPMTRFYMTDLIKPDT